MNKHIIKIYQGILQNDGQVEDVEITKSTYIITYSVPSYWPYDHPFARNYRTCALY